MCTQPCIQVKTSLLSPRADPSLRKFPDCKHTSQGASLCPSHISCTSMTWSNILFPVHVFLSGPLWLLTSHLECYSKSTEGDQMACWVLSDQSCSCPHVQALSKDSPWGALHLSSWVSICQQLHKWSGIRISRGLKGCSYNRFFHSSDAFHSMTPRRKVNWNGKHQAQRQKGLYGLFRISLHFDLSVDAKVTGKPKTLCLKTVKMVIFPKSSFL